MTLPSHPSDVRTAGPWKVGFSDGSGPESITAPDDVVIVRGGESFGLMYGVASAADAAFIVRAVNSHDELVEALKRISRTNEMGDDFSDTGHGSARRTMAAIAEAALAKVQS